MRNHIFPLIQEILYRQVLTNFADSHILMTYTDIGRHIYKQ